MRFPRQVSLRIARSKGTPRLFSASNPNRFTKKRPYTVRLDPREFLRMTRLIPLVRSSLQETSTAAQVESRLAAEIHGTLPHRVRVALVNHVECRRHEFARSQVPPVIRGPRSSFHGDVLDRRSALNLWWPTFRLIALLRRMRVYGSGTPSACLSSNDFEPASEPLTPREAIAPLSLYRSSTRRASGGLTLAPLAESRRLVIDFLFHAD